MLGAVLGVQMAMAAFEAERQYEMHFMQMVKTLPIEQQASAIQARRQAQEKRRLEALEERRHRELCDAIRSVRPSGLGLFW